MRVRQKFIDFKLATNAADQTSGPENIGGATAPLARRRRGPCHSTVYLLTSSL